MNFAPCVFKQKRSLIDTQLLRYTFLDQCSFALFKIVPQINSKTHARNGRGGMVQRESARRSG